MINAIILPFLSNFHLGVILQILVSLALLVYAFRYKKIKRKVHAFIGVVCCIPLVFSFFLAIYGNNDNPGYSENAVIVLGAGIDGETVLGGLAKRLDEAALYYGKNPEAVIVVCGGQGPQEDITEALAMERYLIDKGVPKEVIMKEEQSTSTYENFSFAKTILDERFPQGFSSVLVTSDYHVYRAKCIAEKAGVPANHIGSPTTWYVIPSNYLREMLAVTSILLY